MEGTLHSNEIRKNICDFGFCPILPYRSFSRISIETITQPKWMGNDC